MVLASTQNLKKGSPTLVLENPLNTPFLTWSGGVRAGKLTHRTGCALEEQTEEIVENRNGSSRVPWIVKGFWLLLRTLKVFS